MAPEMATVPLPAAETEKSVGPSVSPARARDSASTLASLSSAAATAAAAPIATSSADRPAESPSPKRNELPKIIVKKEPTSPEPPLRHRPPKLHLNKDPDASIGPPVPRTAGGNLSTMRDVGMACLSPGFATQDPTMREQLQRSISVRDQQRSIIEARLQRHAKPGGAKDSMNEPPLSARASSHRRRPPNSLTIVPPPHQAFANERVVQSAPLNQSFTGRHRPGMIHPPPQHTSHNLQHVNRLPPIADVFASERLDSGARSSRLADPPQSGRHYFPPPRPSQPSPNTMTFPRPRESRSAEEALQMMSGGREDLLPRIIHYGGHQPPTPPSPPQAPTHHTPSKLNVNGDYPPPQSAGRRRNRTEYERDSDNFGPGSRDSPETKRQKKEEFLSLCARAWELFHS